jgi:hypothetical protein
MSFAIKRSVLTGTELNNVAMIFVPNMLQS